MSRFFQSLALQVSKAWQKSHPEIAWKMAQKCYDKIHIEAMHKKKKPFKCEIRNSLIETVLLKQFVDFNSGQT